MRALLCDLGPQILFAILDVNILNSVFEDGMISQSVEYSLRAMVMLGYRHGEPTTVQQIAELTRVPAPYLSKLMQGLVRAGLVRSRRGLGGGFVLLKQPAEITMWDIVDAVDPIKRIRSCPLEIESHESLCPLHRRLDEALAHIENAFRGTTLADILNERAGSTPLCEDKSIVSLKL